MKLKNKRKFMHRYQEKVQKEKYHGLLEDSVASFYLIQSSH